jgi:hypothetical protein
VCDTEQIKCTYLSCKMEASGTRKESDELVKVVICVNRRQPVSPQERGGELNVMILYRDKIFEKRIANPKNLKL